MTFRSVGTAMVRAVRRPRSTFADYVRRSLLVPTSEGSTDRLLEQRLHTFGNDMKVELYAGDVRAAVRAARLQDDRRPRSLILRFDWDTGRLHVTDPTDRLRSESVRCLVTLAGDILMNERRNPRIPTDPRSTCPCGQPH